MSHHFLKHEYTGETYYRSNIHVNALTSSIFLTPRAFLITIALLQFFLYQELNEIIYDCLLRIRASCDQ